MEDFKPKSFWQRPEGVTGAVFLGGLVLGGGYLLYNLLTSGLLATILANTLYLAGTLMVLAAIVYVALDPKARGLISYMYKSVMRWVTGLFVQIDPIGILKSYVEDLKDNLRSMNKQISKLRGQMHKLQEIIVTNKRNIKSNMNMASKAKATNKQSMMILKARKAGRLKVMVKEQERKAIHASHSAMSSAMSVISGDKDKRYMFDMALEAVADDVSKKVGEMERFMDMSSNFMDSVDLQNGIFEEEGMKMLEKWEQEGVSLILGEEKSNLLVEANDEGNVLDLNRPVAKPMRADGHRNQYDSLFE